MPGVERFRVRQRSAPADAVDGLTYHPNDMIEYHSNSKRAWVRCLVVASVRKANGFEYATVKHLLTGKTVTIRVDQKNINVLTKAHPSTWTA